MKIGLFSIAIAWAAAALPLLAADDRQAPVSRIAARIHVDGLLDELIWREAAHIGDFVQVEPRSGDAPSEATRVWLAYTSQALYIAVRAEDRTPRIVANDMRRDAEVLDDDNIEFILDTFHDHRNAYYFATNAAGALVDGRITENQDPATEWDGIWSVRTRVDGQGWTAEFEIPFKTIGFNPGIREWGFNISRHLARNRETSRWASPSLDVELSQVVQAGYVTGLEGLEQGVGLDVKPYGIAGFNLDHAGAGRFKGARDGGADIFWRLTSNLVSATTFNTDFAETEVDERRVNLTRFPLFFPEKRSFFLEDAGVFEFGGSGGGGELLPFFSRRIGLVRGSEAPIRAGEKLTGKIGRFDIGLLDAQTGAFEDETGNVVPGKNLAVGRVKANFWEQSYIGALFTNGDPTGQTSNQVGGVDLKLATSNFLNRRKNFELSLFGSRSRTSGVSGRDAVYGGEVGFPNDLIDLRYSWAHIGQNYNPALGFVQRPGVRVNGFAGEVSPRPRFWKVRQMSFELEFQDYYNLEQRESETRGFEVTPFQWRLHGGEFVTYQFGHTRERLFEHWEIEDGVVLPPGSYSFRSHSGSFRSSPGKPLLVDVEFGSGAFFSGTRRQFEGQLTWRKNRHLTTSLQLERNWLRLPQGAFNTSVLLYRLDYSFTPFIALSNFVQYDTESRNVGLQSRLRWILRPGNDFFVVLNHSWEENGFNRFEAAETRFRAKVNYTVRF